MITSTGSSQVKHVLGLLSKAKERREYGEYVVEGIRMVSEVPSSDLVRIYISESFSKNCEYKYDKAITEVVSDNVYNHMSDTKTPQGIMAIVKMKRYTLSDVLGKDRKGSAPLVLCVENLQDPGNLGTIIRMGEAAGATGVVISSNSVDIYNPKVVRSTMGAIFRVPFAYGNSIDDIIAACKQAGVSIYGAALEGNDVRRENYENKLAFIIGNESAGMTEESKAVCDKLVRIPMCGKVESLNASVAAAVLMYMSNINNL